MKRTLNTISLLVVSFVLALPAVAQVPRGSGGLSFVQHPDLVIERIMFTDVDYGDVACEFELRVRVRNIGSSEAPACNVMLNYCYDSTAADPFRSVVQRMTHALGPKGSSVITFHVPLIHSAGTPWRGMLIAVADPPVAGKPNGEIDEWSKLIASGSSTIPPKAELNNVFGVIFNAGSNITPIHWDNPAVD